MSLTPLTVGVFGQSFGQVIGGDIGTVGVGALKDELARAGYAATVVSHCRGGSAVLKENAPGANPDYYWWDADLNAAGPALTGALATIAAAPSKPTHFILQLGEGDSVASSSPLDKARWISGYANIIWKLKQACNAANPQSVFVTMHMIGRCVWHCPRVQEVREAQLECDAQYSQFFGFDTYDLSLLCDDPLVPGEVGNRHPDILGNGVMGWRAAQRILQALGKPYRMPPIAGVAERKGNVIYLPITAQTVLAKPDKPSHFAIRDGATVWHSAGCDFSWEGNTLIISPAATIGANATLLYPYGELSHIDREGLIRDAHGSPLQTFAKVF